MLTEAEQETAFWVRSFYKKIATESLCFADVAVKNRAPGARLIRALDT